MSTTDTAAHRFAYVTDAWIGMSGATPNAALAAMQATDPDATHSQDQVRPMTPRLARWLSTRGTPLSWATCADGITLDLTDADARVEAVDRFADEVREMDEDELRVMCEPGEMQSCGEIEVYFAASRDDEDTPWEYEVTFGIYGILNMYPYADRESFIAAVRADAHGLFETHIEFTIR